MKLSGIAEKFGWTPLWESRADSDVSQGYVSDILSDVLVQAPKGAILATMITHMNVVAVAVRVGLAGIIFTNSRTPELSVIERAERENLPLYVTSYDSFDTAGLLFSFGIRGRAS